MMKTKMYLMIALLVSSASMCVLAQEKLKQDGEIPIITYGGVPEQTLERYLELKEAGIDICWAGAATAAESIKDMDLAHKAGVKVMLACPELETDTEKTVKLVMRHPALVGYVLSDEPGAGDFARLAAWVKRIQAVDPDHFCYINLLPNYATFHQLGVDDKTLYGVPSYKDYLEKFVKEVPVTFVSFDHYPVVVEGGHSHLREKWYENLEDVRDVAMAAGLPFWTYTLSVAHRIYPIPTIGELRLQMYSNLAYGAQAMQYFAYNGGGYEDYHHGPIHFGKRSQVYHRVQQVNNEIKNLSPVFYNAKVKKVWHSGTHIPSPWRTVRFQEENNPDLIHFKLVKTGDPGALITLLEKNDKHFLVIVNRDHLNPMTLTVVADQHVKLVRKDASIVPVNIYTNTTEVDPGDAIIYVWNGK